MKCMRCGKEGVSERGLCKMCSKNFKYLHGYRCKTGHEWFSVLYESVGCPVCGLKTIHKIGEEK